MKTHLWVAWPDTVLTMCGKKLKHFATYNIEEVDCRMCLMTIIGREEWYAQQLKEAFNKGKSMENVIITDTSNSIDCPFCGEQINPQVTLKVKSATIRQTGTTNHTKTFSSNLDTDIESVRIAHECKGPRVLE